MVSTAFSEAAKPLEQSHEKSQAQAHDGLNAYRMPVGANESHATRQNVIEDGQLSFPPLDMGGSSSFNFAKSTSDQPGPADLAAVGNEVRGFTSPTTGEKETSPYDTRSAETIAIITDQGALPDPGMMVPMWMRLAPPELQPLIQQQYGESSLNGFQPGVKVPGVDEAMDTADDDNT